MEAKNKKVCTCCHTEKDLDLFAVDNRRVTGRAALCRECARAKGRQRMVEKRKDETYKEYLNAWRKDKAAKLKQTGAVLIAQPRAISIIRCVVCGKLKTIKGNRNVPTCGRQCAVKFRASNRIGVSIQRTEKEYKCRECGKPFESTSPGKCEACKRAYKKARRKERKLSIKTVSVHKVIANKVFVRDRWTCQCCGIKVQKKDVLLDSAAEIDHIVPVSLGGPHSYSNVQTLCRRCNLMKSNRYHGQLVMSL